AKQGQFIPPFGETTMRQRPAVLLCLFLLSLVPVAKTVAGDTLDPALAKSDKETSTLWFDVLHLVVEGKGWKDTKSPFDRLPAKAGKMVRPPGWGLSRHWAGIGVRFVTDATNIDARWTLTSATLAMPHMPATGVSGLDLYVKTDKGWRWLGNGRPA